MTDEPKAYLVIHPSPAGLGAALLHPEAADKLARLTNSVVVEVPIIADYRPGRDNTPATRISWHPSRGSQESDASWLLDRIEHALSFGVPAISRSDRYKSNELAVELGVRQFIVIVERGTDVWPDRG